MINEQPHSATAVQELRTQCSMQTWSKARRLFGRGDAAVEFCCIVLALLYTRDRNVM
jgi:hypothetical protein